MASLEGPVNPEGQGEGDEVPVQPRAELVIVLAQQGFGRNEIARRTGFSTATVSRLAKAHGIEFDRAKMERPLKARLDDLRAAQAGAAEGLSEDLIIARTVFRMSRTPRDYAFAAKAITDIQASLYKAMQAATPTQGEEIDDAKSFMGDLMTNIKAFSAELKRQDDLYDRGEFEKLDPSFVEQRTNYLEGKTYDEPN